MSAQPSSQELIDTTEALWQAGIPAIVADRRAQRTTYAPKWQQCCDNVPSQARQDEFRTLLRDGYNTVAVATGIVIDGRRLVAVDVDDSRLVEFAKLMVPSPSHRYGSKGTGLFCWVDKSDQFFKKKQTATIHGHSRAAIELLTRGQNLIVPPSFHPKIGKLYKWTGTSVWECLNDLPILTRETWAIIEAVVGHHSEHAGGQTVEPLLDGEATHNAGMTLVIKLVSLCDDDQIRDIIAALLPKDYDGDLPEELPRMIAGARKKEFDKACGRIRNYDPQDDGPQPLGCLSDGRFVIRDQIMNRIIGCTAQALTTEAGLLGMAPMIFWTEQFPRFGSGGTLVGFHAKMAADAIMVACRSKGPFSLSLIRGRGVWREGDQVIVNLGDPVPDGVKKHYVCFEPLPNLHDDPPDGGDVLDVLRLFNWKRDEDAHLLLGWMMIAPVCGALDWRPHLFMTGPKNTGKTTLVNGISGLLDPLVVSLDGQSTEAGIRQKLGPDSLPVILDEFESDGNRARMKSVIKLARSASSAEGAVARGTPEGRVLEFNIRTTFLFAAINPIPGAAADQSRTVVIELVPHAGDRKVRLDIEQGINWFRESGPAWCRKAITQLPAVLEAITTLRQVMPAVDSRHVTNMATLLAGAWVAREGRPPDNEEAEKWVAQHEALIVHHAEAHEEDDARACLNHLLGWDTGDGTIDGLVAEANELDSRSNQTWNATGRLRAYGIRVDGDKLFIAHQHPGLDRAFRDTRWADGAWKSALSRFGGAEKPRDPIRFGEGVKVRAVCLPISRIFADPE